MTAPSAPIAPLYAATTKRPWQPAPPDPGIKPGGIRDRALRAVWARGPQPEDPAKTKASQEYWAKYRAEQAQKAAAEENSTIPPTELKVAS